MVDIKSGGWRRRVVVMLREPKAGNVKTRLARGIGVARATEAYRTVLGHVIGRLARDRRWELWLAVTPDAAVANPTWPKRVRLRPQGRGDLGQRMQRVMDNMPPGPVVVVGSDIPEISPALISAAFKALGTTDAVFGPARDGGYWLVGFARRKHPPRAFTNVRWSSEHALADTLANLDGLKVAEIATLDDVDNAISFGKLGHLGARLILPLPRAR